MLFTPTALILAGTAQQTLLDSARLDGRTTGTAAPRDLTRNPAARRSARFFALRAARTAA